jgi:hypothetical protein
MTYATDLASLFHGSDDGVQHGKPFTFTLSRLDVYTGSRESRSMSWEWRSVRHILKSMSLHDIFQCELIRN